VIPATIVPQALANGVIVKLDGRVLRGPSAVRAEFRSRAAQASFLPASKPRFIEIPRERGGGKVPFTEEQLSEIRGGLTADEYRWKRIRKSR